MPWQDPWGLPRGEMDPAFGWFHQQLLASYHFSVFTIEPSSEFLKKIMPFGFIKTKLFIELCLILAFLMNHQWPLSWSFLLGIINKLLRLCFFPFKEWRPFSSLASEYFFLDIVYSIPAVFWGLICKDRGKHRMVLDIFLPEFFMGGLEKENIVTLYV